MKAYIYYFKIYMFIVPITGAALFVFSFNPAAAGTGIAESSTVAEWINKGALVVDVRTPEEFNAGNYRGSINIPLAEIEKNINRFGDKNRLIVLYCRSGNRSGKAKLILEKHGYKNVLNGGGLSDMP